jgi:hypothetical protein
MYELLNGILSIIGGLYLYLIAIGKIRSKLEENSLNKFSKWMKMLSILLITYGIISLILVVTKI